MQLPNLIELEQAAETVYRHMQPTPQYCWPLLNQRLGVKTWVKHENHTPLGAFKVRGGLVYFNSMGTKLEGSGIVCATRGNHGQSIAFAAGQFGLSVTIVVPHGNSVEKNNAMRALGAELVEHGDDFQAALEHARDLANSRSLHMAASFTPELVAGVGTYSIELLRAVKDLDAFYVPIGMGSGICGAIAARNALGLDTKIIGVVSEHAPAYALSFESGNCIEAPVTTKLADGMACRRPDQRALGHILKNVEYIIKVSDAEVAQAMRDIYTCTHNVAEGAGAAAFAAIAKDTRKADYQQVAAVLCGGNVDASVFAQILADN